MTLNEETKAGPYLKGVRVLELADEQGEYLGRSLAGMGADVVKVEPTGGEGTRSYGPFYGDEPDLERSLYFWQYNLGKRSVSLDLDSVEGQQSFARLAAATDVIIDTRPRGYLERRGLGADQLRAVNPRVVYVKITPFGEDGPWADYAASDLVHLALGGMMINSGYDPLPDGTYDTPPIAPQMWHAYHITGEMAAMGVLAALAFRHRTGLGQRFSLAVHDAVAKNTEVDIPDWYTRGRDHYRRTAIHSVTGEGGGFSSISNLARTRDGRWQFPYRAYGWLNGFVDGWPGTLAILKKYGMEVDLGDEKYEDLEYRTQLSVAMHIDSVMDRLVAALPFSAELWREGQAQGMPWAAIRKPEENVGEDHWTMRKTFANIEHPEHGRSFTYLASKWVDSESNWVVDRRPPILGEHTSEVEAEWTPREPVIAAGTEAATSEPSKRGKPFALSGVRIIDLTWMLASAGAGRFLAAHGAEVVKVEHDSRIDGMRYGMGLIPDGGREARDSATGPMPMPTEINSPNMSAGFMEINSGKLGISLNLKDPRGKEILTELLREADVVLEGFSPGTMDRMGFGYERLKEINPEIIYVQQSGLGQLGTYGAARTYGPTAQALTGLTDMSGLPEPYPPAGIGYSYLDWGGAYNMGNAILAAVYRKQVTGRGCHIDASQGEVGLYLTGTAVLDYSANGRTWSRYGNRSPYKRAAPHGAFPAQGTDRWVAIACFDQAQWEGLTKVLDPQGTWSADERFAELEQRIAHQDELEHVVAAATASWDRYELMAALQGAEVPAGVVQTAQDRFEVDPQLKHLNWVVEDLEQAEIGNWPVREVPGLLSESPSYIGGRFDRSGPSYGQDTDEFYQRVLGYTSEQIAALREERVL